MVRSKLKKKLELQTQRLQAVKQNLINLNQLSQHLQSSKRSYSLEKTLNRTANRLIGLRQITMI